MGRDIPYTSIELHSGRHDFIKCYTYLQKKKNVFMGPRHYIYLKQDLKNLCYYLAVHVLTT